MNETDVSKRIDWEQMKKEVLALIRRLRQKPEKMKCGYFIEPGSILNAYREGDITFEEAKRELQGLTRKKR